MLSRVHLTMNLLEARPDGWDGPRSEVVISHEPLVAKNHGLQAVLKARVEGVTFPHVLHLSDIRPLGAHEPALLAVRRAGPA